MPVIIVGSEKNFAALRPRLFTGSVSTKAAGQVSSAIQAANPHADLKALKPGTVLTIPDDLQHVAVAGDLSIDGATKEAVAGVLEAGATTVEQLASMTKESIAAGAAERKSLARTLAGKQLSAAAAEDKAVAASLQAAQDALAAADAAEPGRAAAVERAQGEWAAELETLKALLAS
jgi:hypothetical protein